MPQPHLNLERLLTGPHARRVHGLTETYEAVRSLEGAHKRTVRGSDAVTQLRLVMLSAVTIAIRPHGGRHKVSAQRSHTSGYIVQFVFDGSISVRLDGERLKVGPGDAYMIPPGAKLEREETSDQGLSISASIDGIAVRSRLAERLGREVDRPLVFQTRVRAGRDALLAMVISIDHALESGLVRPGDAASEAMQRAFIDLLLDLQPHSYSEQLSGGEGSRKSLRIEIVRGLVDRDPSARLTVEDLARAARCSVRSLQANFAEYCATSPIDYVRRRRLQLARERLLDADCRQPIAEVAADHGFSSASRFAVEYRRLYGETPSETRRSRADSKR